MIKYNPPRTMCLTRLGLNTNSSMIRWWWKSVVNRLVKNWKANLPATDISQCLVLETDWNVLANVRVCEKKVMKVTFNYFVQGSWNILFLMTLYLKPGSQEQIVQTQICDACFSRKIRVKRSYFTLLCIKLCSSYQFLLNFIFVDSYTGVLCSTYGVLLLHS